MVQIQEYKDDQFMINVTKEEALRIIKSLAGQLYNDDCNTDRVEFGKRHGDDVTYFSIAVDESKSKFHVITNMIGNLEMNSMVFYKCDTLDEAKKFIREFKDQGIIGKSELWIREVVE